MICKLERIIVNKTIVGNNQQLYGMSSLRHRPYFNMLSFEQKRVYNSVLLGLERCLPAIEIPYQDERALEQLITYVRLDNPLLFYLESIKVKTLLFSNKQTIEPKYSCSHSRINETITALLEKSQKLISDYRGGSVNDVEMKIHDYFCKNVSYDLSEPTATECVGPILYNKGVCEGVSKAAKLLFDLCNIQSTVIIGKALVAAGKAREESHSWNIVNLNSSNYHLDITYDLSLSCFGTIRYDYFNLSDAEITKDHAISISPPILCPSEYNFYNKQKQYFNSMQECLQFIKSSMRAGKTDIVFKIDEGVMKGNEFGFLQNQIVRIMDELRLFGRRYQILYNEKQLVFHVHKI